MSIQYDNYLQQHKSNVAKAFYWIRDNIPDLIKGCDGIEQQICYAHDYSKNDTGEYGAYDAYFYGGNRSFQVVRNFNRAWLSHIHKNPHHWQHWILINDDPNEGEVILDMPYEYVVEMVCDWWAFSFASGNLEEIFKWYDEHKDYMKLSHSTRKLVENILMQIKIKLSAT